MLLTAEILRPLISKRIKCMEHLHGYLHSNSADRHSIYTVRVRYGVADHYDTERDGVIDQNDLDRLQQGEVRSECKQTVSAGQCCALTVLFSVGGSGGPDRARQHHAKLLV